MRKRAFYLFILILSKGFLYSQVTNDSLGVKFIYPQFYETFSAEESWQIHKEAYIKQLKAEGLTEIEIDKKIVAYEKQKIDFIEKMTEQKRKAAIQRQKADEQRKQAVIQRKQAEDQRIQADILHQKAEEQRKEADVLREKVAVTERQNERQRKKAVEQRKQAEVQRQEALKLREEAEVQRKKAEILRREAEEWRNSFENIISERIIISSQSSNMKPIIINVNKKTPLLFSINGKISSGITLVEIINPNGKKEGELSLEHKPKLESIREDDFLNSTSGSLYKTISASEVGDWQIKISAKNSEGTVNVSVAQYAKPTLNE